MEKIYVAILVPQEGMLVRDPITKKIMLKDGEKKPMTGKEGRYWRRRINDGSVKIFEKNKTTRRKKPQTKEE